MTYPNLSFKLPKNRPFYFTNFVATVDGKVQVINNDKKDYWPIGSSTDYKTLLELRAYADVLIHGSNTALGHRTVDTLARPDFKEMRKKLGKKNELLYIVMSNHPDENLKKQLENPNGVVYEIVGSDVKKLSDKLYKQGYKTVLVEGGPNILGSFFKENLIDEIFLTIAPKIFGNRPGETLTMVEGVLFDPKDVKQLKLLSVKQIENELFLRYRVNH